jgi:protein AIR1/2
MTHTHPPEIIDLTECTPSPEVVVIEISDGDGDALAATTVPQEPVTRSPRKRWRKSKLTARGTRAEELPVTPPDDGSTLFFIDVHPTSFPVPAEPVVDANGTSDSHDGSLLLPPHASLASSKQGEDPVEILLPPQPEENGDYIEYLDYDDSKVSFPHLNCHPADCGKVNDFGRYFDDPEENVKAPKVICKRCGAEGEHRTSDCPVETVCIDLWDR